MAIYLSTRCGLVSVLSPAEKSQPRPKLPLQRYDEAMEASNSSFGLCNLQSAHRAVRCRKLVGVDSEPVQHREVEVGEWIVVVFVEAQVLPVFEITTSQ